MNKEQFLKVSVEVQSDNADINIYRTDEKDIIVKLEGETSTNRKWNFDVDTKDSLLSVTYKEKFISWFHFDLFHVYTPVTLNVYLPEKEFDSFHVKNVNGDIFVEKQKLNDLKLKSVNGDIEISDINSGKLVMETSNGDLGLLDVITNHMKVDSVNGSIILDQIDGDIEGKTTNGNISVITKDLDKNIKLKTVNGDMLITTGQEPINTQFNVSVVNGDVDILNKYTGNATLGNGEFMIELITTNGDIIVEKN